MAMNPDVGHLYHDFNITNAYTVLDAKEKMKTRERNARETKYLDKYSTVIDRAKTVCKRQNEWEQRSIRKQLANIKSKTPTLAKSLRLESERIKSETDGHNAGIRSRSDSSLSSDPRNQIYVSSWSVYSHLRSDKKQLVTEIHKKGNGYTNNRKDKLSIEETENTESIKSAILRKKAEQVTKTLHKLYTNSVERKWQERNMTVLDVLGNESKVELEKALFVLRGSPVGDAIEDILKKKQLISKPSKVSDSITTVKKEDKLFQDDDFDQSDRKLLEKNSDIHEEVSLSSTSLNSVYPYSDSPNFEMISAEGHAQSLSTHMNSTRNGSSVNTYHDGSSVGDTDHVISDVFQRDDTWMMSSTVANPSEPDSKYSSLRWTDIFKTPELWKQSNSLKGNRRQGVKPKQAAVVTLTGKHRHTLLK